MVAPIVTTDHPPAPPQTKPAEATSSPPTLYRFTTVDYNHLYEQHIISPDRRTELIDGTILDMSPIGVPHFNCVNALTQQLVLKTVGSAIVSIQNSIQLDEHSQPQPDVALLTIEGENERTALPKPEEILLLIEVADSTLTYDRDIKGPLYAAAGIREFWLIDLQGDCVELYRDPSPNGYRTKLTRDRPDTIAPEALPDCQLALDTILPKPEPTPSES